MEMAQSIQATFAKAGVDLQIIASDDKQQTSKIRARKYETAIGRWGPDYQDPHTNAQNFGMNVDNGENPPMKTTAWRTSWDLSQADQGDRGRGAGDRHRQAPGDV